MDRSITLSHKSTIKCIRHHPLTEGLSMFSHGSLAVFSMMVSSGGRKCNKFSTDSFLHKSWGFCQRNPHLISHDFQLCWLQLCLSHQSRGKKLLLAIHFSNKTIILKLKQDYVAAFPSLLIVSVRKSRLKLFHFLLFYHLT